MATAPEQYMKPYLSSVAIHGWGKSKEKENGGVKLQIKLRWDHAKPNEKQYNQRNYRKMRGIIRLSRPKD
jgi:hypothetical protein